MTNKIEEMVKEMWREILVDTMVMMYPTFMLAAIGVALIVILGAWLAGIFMLIGSIIITGVVVWCKINDLLTDLAYFMSVEEDD